MVGITWTILLTVPTQECRSWSGMELPWLARPTRKCKPLWVHRVGRLRYVCDCESKLSSHRYTSIPIPAPAYNNQFLFHLTTVVTFPQRPFLLTQALFHLSRFLSVCLLLSLCVRDLNMLADSEHPQHLELHTQMKAGKEAILRSVSL